MKNILITGGTGFIGSHTFLKFLEEGFNIAISYADTSRMYNLLNWKPSKSIEDMCKDGWNWQKKLISVQK